MSGEISENEYTILENIYDSGESRPLKQRDLSRIAGTSLGMTNSILKRLTKKGWVTIKRLNSRNIQYAVTIEGINEIMRRSYRYFKRVIKNAVFYKESLEDIVRRQKSKNTAAVILVGYSELDFIIEHVCRREGLSFLVAADAETVKGVQEDGAFRIYAENFTRESGGTTAAYTEQENNFYLSDLVFNKAASINSKEYHA